MDYFQGVVTEYLVAHRACYVNTELLIQLDSDEYKKGRHWYCDAAAANFAESTLYLCEVTYSKTMSGLAKRLLAWSEHWPELKAAIRRDCSIPDSWQIQPWAFIPKTYHAALSAKIGTLPNAEHDGNSMPFPKVTYLEDVVPWKYVTWDRKVSDLEEET